MTTPARAAQIATLIAPFIPQPGSLNRASRAWLMQQAQINVSSQTFLDAVAWIRDHIADYPYPISFDGRGYHFYYDPERYLIWSAPRNKAVNTYNMRTYSEGEKLLTLAIAQGDPTAQFILNQMTQQSTAARQMQDTLQQYLTSVFPSIVTH